MIRQESLDAAKQAYDIEAACITEMKNYLDEAQFSKAVELLAGAPKSARQVPATPASCASISAT